MHKIKIRAAIQPRKCTFSFSPGEAIRLRADSVNDSDGCCCSPIAGGGAVTRFCLSAPDSFRAPRPTGDSFPSDMPQLHTDVLTGPVRLVWRPTITTTRPPLVTASGRPGLFFFSSLPSDLSSLLSQEHKKTPPSVKTRYDERRLFLHSHRNIEGSLFPPTPPPETSWCGVQPV